MAELIEIRGKPTEFEAAVVAVVLDRIAREELSARLGGGRPRPGLPAWIRALRPEDPRLPLENPRPE